MKKNQKKCLNRLDFYAKTMYNGRVVGRNPLKIHKVGQVNKQNEKTVYYLCECKIFIERSRADASRRYIQTYT